METGAEESKTGRGRRRWWIAGAVFVIAVAALWQLVERLVQVDQYRPQIEQELAELTGLSVAIGSLQLAWRPIPCLSATDVTIGEGDFQAVAARVDVYPALHTLLWRELDILDVAIRELSVTLPEDSEAAQKAASGTWAHVEAALDEPDSASPSFIREVVVRRVTAHDLVLRLGAGSDPVLEGSVTAKDVTGDRIGLALEAAVPERLRASAQGAVDLSEPGAVQVSFEGDVAAEGESPLKADFQGQARLGGEPSDTVQLEMSGEGLALSASAELGAATALRVASLRVKGAALRELLDLLEGGGVDLSTGADATLEASELRVGFPSGASPRLDSGTIAIRGLVAKREGETLADDLRAEAKLADGAIEVESLRGGPLTLRGRIAPDADWSHVELALSGQLTLADAWLHGLGAPDSLRDVQGVLEIDELAGRFPPESGNAPVTVRAHLPDGSLRIVSDGFEDSFSAIQLTLGMREDRVSVDGSVRSATLGAITTTATAVPNDALLEGELVFDLAGLAGYIPDESARSQVEPVLASYGRSHVGFRLTPISGADGDYRLLLERSQPPDIDADLTLRTQRDPFLGDVELTADFPAATMHGILPPHAHVSGSTRAHLERNGSNGALIGTYDLTNAAIATGHFVEKKRGEVLTFEVDREAEKGNFSWAPRRLSLTSATGRVSFAIDEGNLVAPDLDVDLADWSFLLVDTAHASGTIRGSFDSRIPSAQLVFSHVALRFSPEVGLDSVDGTVALDGEKWGAQELRLRGEQTDATLDAQLLDNRLEGKLAGASLDVDFVRLLIGEIEALRGESEPEPERLSGSFVVQLDRVGIGHSVGKRLHAQVALKDGDVQVSNFGFETDQGAVTGTASVDAREGEPSQLALEFEARNLSGPFLDDLLDEEPREIEGIFDVKVRFEAPLRDDPKAMMAEASGALVANGRKGTFGRLGFATKLVTVLRSTETLRLKLPTFRDEGLVFDDTWLEMTMDKGLLKLSRFDLESTSYAVTATGQMDFRREQSKVPIEVNAIKGLTGIVQYIPLAGDALKLVNVRLVATGSPYDLKVGVASIQDQLIGVGMVGPMAVINGVGDVLRLMQGKGLKKNGGGKLTLPPPLPGEVPAPAPAATTTEPAPALEPEAPPTKDAAGASPAEPPAAPPPPEAAPPSPPADS